MIRRIIKLFGMEISGVHNAAYLLGLFTILSQILAIFRDRLLAGIFGGSINLDIYYASFKIPDFIFLTVGSLVSISVLVPMFSRRSRDGKIKDYMNSIFTVFSVAIVLFCILTFIFMPFITKFLFRGFDVLTIQKVVFTSRLLLLSPLILGLSNFFGSVVQYHKRFILYSISPVIYNIGIILGIVFGTKIFGITAVVWGVIFGAVLHFIIQFVYVVKSHYTPKFILNIRNINWSDIKETTTMSLPRTLALSFTQIISITFTSIATLFGPGSVAVLNFATNLQSVPLSIIGASYSIAAFPTLSDFFANNNISEYSKHLGSSLRHIIFWSIPASFLFIVLRAHIVRVILGSGAFDWADTRLTSAIMAVFAVSFVFQSIQLFLTRAHYAISNTKAPVIWGIIGAISIIGISTVLYFGFLNSFVFYIAEVLKVDDLAGFRIMILPLAFSIGSIVTSIGLWIGLPQVIKAEAKDGMLKSFYNSIAVGFIMGLMTYAGLRLWGTVLELDSVLAVFLHAFISGIIGIGIGVGFLVISGNREMKEILKRP